MSWRGQGGKRAKGRRGDQDSELDNTSWLADLEREAAQADEDEDDWASTLRSRRAGSGPAGPPDPGYPAPSPSSAGSPDQAPPGADPDWAWRPPASDPYGEPPPGREEFGGHGHHPAPEADWSDPGTGSWSTVDPLATDPGDSLGRGAGYRNGRDPGYGDIGTPNAPSGPDPGYAPGPGPDYPAAAEPGYPDAPLAGRGANEPAGYPEPPEAEPPVGREPDYPALFGELYRRSAGQQDPIWEAPPPVEPLPEAGPADPVTGTWPFEETTQSWEPSDRSFIWPSDELPSAPAEWEQQGPAPWDDPDPLPPARPDPQDPGPDQTAAWPAPTPAPDPAPWPAPADAPDPAPPPAAWPGPAPDPAPRPAPGLDPSPWAGRTGTGNGVPPQPPGPVGPPPDDWAAAIPTDVPAASRAADPASATRVWRTDDVDAEPGVPLGPVAGAPPGVPLGPGGVPPGGGAAARTSRLRGSPGPGAGVTRSRTARDPAASATRTRPTGRADALAPDRRTRDVEAGTGYDIGGEPGDVPRKGAPGRPAGERQARAWPRIVAVISWIVLVMVVCWFYVFPWLERVLPENF
jgi:hypothetical protein